jgi:hypothetical protein
MEPTGATPVRIGRMELRTTGTSRFDRERGLAMKAKMLRIAMYISSVVALVLASSAGRSWH